MEGCGGKKGLTLRSMSEWDKREALNEYLINNTIGERRKPNKQDHTTLLWCLGNKLKTLYHDNQQKGKVKDQEEKSREIEILVRLELITL